MKRLSVSQEGLKITASLTMLIDHIGAVLVYAAYRNAWNAQNYAVSNAIVPIYEAMRVIGRVAFPIYCFLLVEGFHHTRNVKKYMQRLVVGMLLSEIPFDLAFSGDIDWTGSSVMVTLLLGCGMMLAMERVKVVWWKLALVLPFGIAADLLGSDYGGHGIAIIAMLYLTRGMPREKLWRTAAFVVLLWFGAEVTALGITFPMELLGFGGVLLTFCYDGRKLTKNKWMQWGFYLFYPVHILVLWILKVLLYG